VVTTLVPLFGATGDGVCFAALALCPAVPPPIELPVTAPPAGVGFVTLPTAAGFVTTEVDEAVPPMTGAGFDAPPIAPCFVLAGPPSAFWAREGGAKVAASMPVDTTSNIVLIMVQFFFIGAIFAVAKPASAHRPRRFIRALRVRISLSQAMEM
jgi:hypothetical protein